jgi:hypothetical protein
MRVMSTKRIMRLCFSDFCFSDFLNFGTSLLADARGRVAPTTIALFLSSERRDVLRLQSGCERA